MRMSDMIPIEEEIEQARQANPDFRRLWDECELGRSVATALVRYRIDHNLTQQALAELLGVHQSNVARLESGERNPTLRELARVTAATGLTFRLTVNGGNVALDEAA
jgi:DNA-binding XRE family transcriptional regulator